jgi:MerR family transcriptional regulator, copper efflux regulator
VPASLQIKDIAARTGFSATTLRYYEEIGLLPETLRTSTGYRTYEESTVELLAFIARAKQLGCTLDEIRELAAAWSGGECGPLQERLQRLVTVKLAAAQRQVVELMTLTSDLQQTLAVLEGHRPAGPCDDRCGCVADTTADTAQPVALVAKSSAFLKASPPIACTLGAASMSGRLAEWQSLLGHVARRTEIGGGIRLQFEPAVPRKELMRLTSAEQDCCQFFDFAITIDRRGLALEVRAPEQAIDVVRSLFGVAL